MKKRIVRRAEIHESELGRRSHQAQVDRQWAACEKLAFVLMNHAGVLFGVAMEAAVGMMEAASGSRIHEYEEGETE